MSNDSHAPYTLEELARQLGRDRREIEKLVERGRIPGRKVAGEWLFHPSEITHWLETELRAFTDRELQLVEQSNRSAVVNADIPVTSLLHPETCQVPLEARTKRSVLESLVEVAGRTWQIWEPAKILSAVREREDLMPTAYDNGIAIPHTRNPLPDALGEPVIAFGRTYTGIPFGAPRGQLTDLFFMVLSRDSRTHLHVLARLGRLLQQPDFIVGLRRAESSTEAYQFICAADEKIGRE